ncbi:MAG: kelch repeat-containing protein [Patescibacteria group bacterium]|jgi:N-acetylneuraminic acid mutarotase
MKKFFWLVALILGIGLYLRNIQGWDWERARALPGVSYVFKEDASATTTPIGQRGTGTHWETASSMPFARADFGTVVVGDRIFIIGGHDGYARTLVSVLVYDIPTDLWSEVAPLPQALHHPAVATDGKQIFVVGGLTSISSRPLDVVYAYDPIRNSWSELGQLNDFRGDAAAAYVGDRLVILGGTTTAGTDGAFEAYDLDRKGWNGLPTMPTARRGHQVAVMNGELFVFGGRFGTSKDILSTQVFKEVGEWKSLRDMPASRRAFGTFVHEGKIHVLGGLNDTGLPAFIDAYDPAKDAWSSFPLEMPHPRHGLGVATYKNRVYVIGGGMRKGFSVSDLNEVLILETAAVKK